MSHPGREYKEDKDCSDGCAPGLGTDTSIGPQMVSESSTRALLDGIWTKAVRRDNILEARYKLCVDIEVQYLILCNADFKYHLDSECVCFGRRG